MSIYAVSYCDICGEAGDINFKLSRRAIRRANRIKGWRAKRQYTASRPGGFMVDLCPTCIDLPYKE